MSWDMFLKFSTTCATYLSIAFLTSTGLEPWLINFNPSSTITVVSKVDVVVPSPASLADLIDTCFTNCAPKSSTWSSNSWNDFATVTPSLVTFTSPDLSLIKTVLPPGPNVEDTEWFNCLIPANNLFFSSIPKTVCVAIFN